MAQEGKKISFGFSKSIKKPDLKPVIHIESRKVDYIEYVDDKSIKVIGKEEKKDVPLVIPMLGSKSWHDRIINKINADIYGPSGGDIQKNGNTKLTHTNKKLTNGKNKHDATDSSTAVDDLQKQKQAVPDKSTVSLEELAAREIIKDLKEEDEEEEPSVDITIEQSNNLEGEKEPTLENYEEIPIDKFGLALLRGMGWEPEKGIGKNSKVVAVTVPNLRPRGMGLGADKVILQKQNVKPKTKEEQELKLEKGCYVRIIAGKYNNSYGVLEGFDDESGRLIVKLALGNKCVSLNEYLIEPVTKENYAKNSKVLNISTYEQFNNDGGGRNRTKNSPATEANSREEDRNVQNKSLNNERNVKYRARSNSSDASSDADGKRKRKYESNNRDHHHKSKKSKKHRRHDDSELSRKNTKKDKDREKTRDRSKSHHSSKSTDKKKNKRHKRSRSRSLGRR